MANETYLKSTIEGNLHSVTVSENVIVKTDNYTVTASDNGKVFGIATDAKVFTLPATSNGLKYRWVNLGAAGNNIITISPQATDAIFGTITLAASVVVMTGVDNKDVINTKATSQKGDWIELTADGNVGWIITGSAGIWASE